MLLILLVLVLLLPLPVTILVMKSREILIRSILLLTIWIMLSRRLRKLLLSMIELKYFKDEEFRKATPSCSLSDMDDDFMSKLDCAREIARIPFVINSAFRTPDYEKSKGRSGNSVHTEGKAVDLRCLTNDVRYRIIDALIMVGFRRIGIGSNFIHVDSGYPEAVNPIIWLY